MIMANVTEILEIIKSNNGMIDTSKLKHDLKLSEQGIDSLDRTSIYFEVEEKYGIKLDQNEESKYATINDLVNYINDTNK